MSITNLLRNGKEIEMESKIINVDGPFLEKYGEVNLSFRVRPIDWIKIKNTDEYKDFKIVVENIEREYPINEQGIYAYSKEVFDEQLRKKKVALIMADEVKRREQYEKDLLDDVSRLDIKLSRSLRALWFVAFAVAFAVGYILARMPA